MSAARLRFALLVLAGVSGCDDGKTAASSETEYDRCEAPCAHAETLCGPVEKCAFTCGNYWTSSERDCVSASSTCAQANACVPDVEATDAGASDASALEQ